MPHAPCVCSWVEEACNEASQVYVLEAALRLLRAMPFQAAVLEQSGGCPCGCLQSGRGPIWAPVLVLRWEVHLLSFA